MKCDECGSTLTVEERAVRRYDIGGLPHVELHGVEVSNCPECGKEGIAIPRLGQLHRVLADAFLRQERTLAPDEIRFLRKHIGLSMADCAQRIGVTRETLSRWENGAQPMGPSADRLLRVLVLTHEPSTSYHVDDLLKDLNLEPMPEKLQSLPIWNSLDKGWAPQEQPELASV